MIHAPYLVRLAICTGIALIIVALIYLDHMHHSNWGKHWTFDQLYKRQEQAKREGRYKGP
jgi:hypothetical protein